MFMSVLDENMYVLEVGAIIWPKKEDFSYVMFPYLFSVPRYVSLFSVCYQATNVSPIFLCVTVKQMLV